MLRATVCVPLSVARRWSPASRVLRQSSSRHSTSACSPERESGAEGAGHLTLEREHEAWTEVKKSKFRAIAWPISSAEQALAGMQARRDPSASHNCWAFRVGQQYRSSDDGEPGGTAGRPILAAIEGGGLDGVAVLVVRWFGGIKLGAGGLVRAYGGAARECLREAPKRQVSHRVQLQLGVPFEQLGIVYALLEQHGAARASESYGTDGVELQVSVEAASAGRLEAAVQDATSGRVRPLRVAAAEGAGL